MPELTTEKCFNIFDKLAEAGVFNIFLTGGDPLLRQDLHKLVKHCYHVGLEPTVSTNGMHLTDKNIKALVSSGLTNLQVSIHGYAEAHDSIVGVPGSYKQVLNNLKNIVKSKSIDIEIACVGLMDNFKYIPDLLCDLAAIGIKSFRILRLLTSHSKELLNHIPSRQIIEEYMPKIDKIAKNCGIKLMASFCPGLMPTPRYIYQDVHPMAITCPAGKTEFAILPNGDVYPCVNLKDSPTMCVGNILHDSVHKLWMHPTMVKLRKLTPDDYKGYCGKCEMKYACYSARCVAFNLTGDIYGDDISCYIIQERLRVNNDSMY